MAINNTSSLNEFIAQSLTRSNGTDAALQTLAAGNLPQSSVDQINSLVTDALANAASTNRADIPTDLYDQVAEIMVASVPGMSKQILSSVLQSNNILGKIGNPTSINIGNQLAGLQNLYDKKLNQVLNSVDDSILKMGLPGFAQSAAVNLINDTTNIINDALSSGNILNSLGDPATISNAGSTAINKILSNNGLLPASDVLGPQSTQTATNFVNNLADDAGIIDLTEISDTATNTLAGAVMQGENGGNLEQYASIADQTSGTIQSLTEEEDAELIGYRGPDSYRIGEENVQPGGQFISSVEELEAEMASMTRDISEIIVHWSETFTNANLSASELTSLTGSGDNAYHLIIQRNGAVERGVPLNSVGSHCPTNGHNSYSIGVCLVGGINVPTDTRAIEMELSPRSITQSQYNSLYQIFRTFFDQYPGGQALGHMDIDTSQDDPGFDVRDYVYNNFNKQSLYLDPPNDPALSPQDILKALEGQGPDVLTKDPDVLEKKF